MSKWKHGDGNSNSVINFFKSKHKLNVELRPRGLYSLFYVKFNFRVSIMEQKIDQVNQRKNGTTSTRNREIDNKTNSNDSDSESDDDYEEFVSWRKKK